MKATFDAPIRTSAVVVDRILASGHPAVIVFEVPSCGPCQALRPILDELAHEYGRRVLVLRVADVQEGWLAARYHLAFVPTLLFCRDGREVARIKGNAGRTAIHRHIEYLLNGENPPEPAEGPRHTVAARFGPVRPDRSSAPRALLFPGH